MTEIKDKLIKIDSVSAIPEQYVDTPIELLLKYHNLGKPLIKYSSAQILIGMCMDNRKHLTIPDNFAFIIRTAGANMRDSEFKMSYAIAVGGVKHIALIGHNNCGMVDLNSRKDIFIEGMINNAGWTREAAIDLFEKNEPLSEIHNEADFILSETARLRVKFPKIQIAPMLYLVEDNKLYLIKE